MELSDQTKKEIAGNFKFRFDAFVAKNTHTKNDVMRSLGFPAGYATMIGNELQWLKVPKKFWEFLKEFDSSLMTLAEWVNEKGITITKAPKVNHLPPEVKKPPPSREPKKKSDQLTGKSRGKATTSEVVQINFLESIKNAIKNKILSPDMTAELFQSLSLVLEKDDRYPLCRAIINAGMEQDELQAIIRYIGPSAYPGKSILTIEQINTVYDFLNGRSKEEVDMLLKMATSGVKASEAGEALRKTLNVGLEIDLVLKLNGKPITSE